MLVHYDAVGSHGVCPYLEDRRWGSHMLWVEQMSRQEYLELLERGYRRSGRLVYQPRCGVCTECRSVRVLVDRFRPSRNHRRTLKRNSDLTLTVGTPRQTPERLVLHNRYNAERHGRDPTGDMTSADYRLFMVESPVPTLELTARYADGRLALVALVDALGTALSSIFTFYDPDEPERSLGTWGILQTLALARELDARHLHLGFYIADCRAMNYKLRFRPAELLQTDGEWVRVD